MVLMPISALSKYSFGPIQCYLLRFGADMQRREFITLLYGARPSSAVVRLDDPHARSLGAWHGVLTAFVPLVLLTSLIAVAGTMVFTPARAETDAALSAQALGKEAEYYNQRTQRGDNGDWNGAAEAFKQALQINPNDADAHFELGETYRALQRYPEAVAEYQAVIRLKPDDGEATLYWGMAENAQGHYAAAIDPLKKAVSLFPEDARAEAPIGPGLA
jgi:tetratricopeptide (TPR) repeat protein